MVEMYHNTSLPKLMFFKIMSKIIKMHNFATKETALNETSGCPRVEW